MIRLTNPTNHSLSKAIIFIVLNLCVVFVCSSGYLSAQEILTLDKIKVKKKLGNSNYTYKQDDEVDRYEQLDRSAPMPPPSPDPDTRLDLSDSDSRLNCTHPDWPSLNAIYQNLNGANWSNPWPISNCDPCNYPGIQCSGGRVFSINVPNETTNLTGELPDNLDTMTSCVFISFNRSRITGTLPASIGNMSQLQTLDLSGEINFNFPSLTGTIPNNWSGLTNLTWLNLGGHDLSGNIPAFIGNYTQLELFDVVTNNFSGSYQRHLVT